MSIQSEPTEGTGPFPAWATSAEGTLSRMGTEDTGLSGTAAAALLKSNGPNELRRAEPESALSRLLRQLRDPMIYVLIGAAVLTALLRHWVDTAVIAAVVIINMLVGFIQEGKAADALASIRSMLSPEATVLRDATWRTIDAGELVTGDIVTLAAGDRVPADLRLLTATNLHIEEAALTGESEPVSKDTDPVDAGSGLGDRTCMAFSGTTVVRGSGTGVVTATGSGTAIGAITTMLDEVDRVDTPLTRSMTKFSSTIAVVCVVLAVVMMATSALLHGMDFGDLIIAGIGFAVAAIPEGLPAVIAITLALGVQKMARRNAITRRLNSVETLGSVTTICTDKTGTLTRNEMTVREVLTAKRHVTVTGSGYSPEGEILDAETGLKAEPDADLNALALVAATVNDAGVDKRDGEWVLTGEPTDGGIRVFAMKAGVAPAERLSEVPFDSEYKYMATLQDVDGRRTILVKGAPDRLLARCGNVDRALWNERIDALGSRGLRVLAAARRQVGREVTTITTDDIDAGGFEFLGIYGIQDPPRKEAIRAVKVVQEAGIRVRMITGDHASTARAIAREVGISGDSVATGAEIEHCSEEELRDLVARTDVFVRTSPEHKLRIVRALQENGEVVSMTGDGVNDAPSLKQADVGVAMGIKGTEASRDAADIVLADDNFATIAVAVEMGRTIFDNLRKAIVFMLPTNGAQGLVIFVALILGLQLPITPLQVLWINLITAVTLSLALSFEPAEPGIMKRPPRDASVGLLDRVSAIRITYVSLFLGASAFFAMQLALRTGASLEVARTIAVHNLAIGQVFYLLSSRFTHVSALRRELFSANPVSWLCMAAMVILQLIFGYFPPMQFAFGTASVPFSS